MKMAELLPLKVYPCTSEIEKGDKNENDRAVSPKSIPMYF